MGMAGWIGGRRSVHPEIVDETGRTVFFNETPCRLIQKQRHVALSKIGSGRLGGLEILVAGRRKAWFNTPRP
jgi:hypothetical protein